MANAESEEDSSDGDSDSDMEESGKKRPKREKVGFRERKVIQLN